MLVCASLRVGNISSLDLVTINDSKCSSAYAYQAAACTLRSLEGASQLSELRGRINKTDEHTNPKNTRGALTHRHVELTCVNFE